MKKLLMIFTLVVAIFLLVACEDKPTDKVVTDEILSLIHIGFESEDHEASVTNNINLVTTLEGFDDVILTWTSSEPDTIQIEGNLGIVNRKEIDTPVTLSVEVKVLEDTEYKYFNLIVLKKENEEEPLKDIVAPVITGTTNIEVEVGSSKPDYLLGVTATDDVDGSVEVTIDDSKVDLNKEGTYNLTYTATDIAGNKAEITVTVTVVAKPVTPDLVAPVITGTTDIEVEVGSSKPNYLFGVSATDDVDGSVEVFVDDSEVDLNTVGSYDLIYYATDLAGNRKEIVVQVTVIEKVTHGEETLIHHFEFTNELQHGYSDESETAVIKDNITNTNIDILKKRANTNNNNLILSGASESQTIAWIVLNFSQDIHKIVFDVSAWSSIDLNAITAFKLQTQINGVWTDLEDLLPLLTTEVQTLEITDIAIDNLRIYVDGNIGSQNTARVRIDNLKIYHIVQKSAEERNAETDFNALTIPTTFIEETTINFPTTGLMGSSITWSFKDSSNPSNALINLNTGVINIPNDGQAFVELEAVVKNGIYEFEKTFNLILGEGEPISISEAKSLTNDSYVNTQGVITSLHKNDSQTFIFITDDSGSIYIVAPNGEALNLKAGDEVNVKGKKFTQNSFQYISQIRSIEKLGTKSVTPVVVTSDELNNHPAAFVSIFGLISKTYHTNDTEYVLYTNQGSFKVIIPSTLENDAKTAIQQKLSGLDAGIHVLVVAPVFKEGSNYYLYVTDEAQVTVDNTIDFNEVSAVILNNILLPEFDHTVSKDLDLSHEGELLFGSTILWESSNTTVLSNTGIITQSDEDQNVTLTYTIYFDGEVVKTASFNLTVVRFSPYEGYYASLSGLSGQSLRQALTNMIKNTGTQSGSTSQVRSVDAWEGKTYNIYTGLGSYGNREHVVPASKLREVNAKEDDLHNLRAAVVSVNSTRSNYPFTNAATGPNWKLVNGAFYPGSEHLGDVARIVLYITLRNNIQINKVGNLQMFLDWHEQDPVNEFELTRNQRIFGIQKSRNPFIDHPELVEVLFGNA